MARLVKNIDTLCYGSLKAGRLLNGLMDESKIAELIASGHAIVTKGDRSVAFNEKEAESGDVVGTNDSNANTGADKKNNKTPPKSKGD